MTSWRQRRGVSKRELVVVGLKGCLGCLVVALANGALSQSQDQGWHSESCTSNSMHDCAVEQSGWLGEHQMRVPPDCRVAMAPSDFQGWGLFALTDVSRGTPVLPGDLVLQVPDLLAPAGFQLLLRSYLWDSHETGGQLEGQSVISVISGVGMLANGHVRYANVLPFVPTVDDAGIERHTHPGAGAFTHYHNYTFFVQRDLSAGSEILVQYGQDWFRERHLLPQDSQAHVSTPHKSREWLVEHGHCVDNLTPGPSTNPDAGRGAFATRFLPKHSIVAPVPVLPIANKHTSLSTLRFKATGHVVQGWQLWRNYCLGHPNSSLLLYPYSPYSNLINHNETQANVQWQWSRDSQHMLDWPLSQIEQMNQSGLLLELVALRDINEGEEIFVDYGPDWQEAWNRHVQDWVPAEEAYIPSFRMNVTTPLRTEEELRQDPYPDNIFTSCFYPYTAIDTPKNVTMDRWNRTRGFMDLRNLRPCSILQREVESSSSYYTVQIRNRYGLRPHERLPKGHVHIVTHVPRYAIQFTDKLYTTDAHLEWAFRHEIGLPIFPAHWMDLK